VKTPVKGGKVKSKKFLEDTMLTREQSQEQLKTFEIKDTKAFYKKQLETRYLLLFAISLKPSSKPQGFTVQPNKTGTNLWSTPSHSSTSQQKSARKFLQPFSPNLASLLKLPGNSRRIFPTNKATVAARFVYRIILHTPLQTEPPGYKIFCEAPKAMTKTSLGTLPGHLTWVIGTHKILSLMFLQQRLKQGMKKSLAS
jgi:hypothetical protein